MSKLLVVEDEAHIASGLRFNLEAEGHEVVIADTGEAGDRLHPFSHLAAAKSERANGRPPGAARALFRRIAELLEPQAPD